MLRRMVQALIVVYAAVILGFVWLTKDLTVANLLHDPLFAGYSIAVVVYLQSRFVNAMLYRPAPDAVEVLLVRRRAEDVA
ncbi:MAG: hypothetical protein WD770_01955, partial [Actinomycetota bacterium]